MKAKLLLFFALISLSACSLFYTPKGTVKSFMAAAEKGDVEKMTELFSKNAIERLGVDKIRSNSQNFAETAKRGVGAGGSYRMENVEEAAIPTGQRVSLDYRNDSDSIRLVFDLRKGRQRLEDRCDRRPRDGIDQPIWNARGS